MDLTLLHPKVVHLPIALGVLMPLLSGGLLIAWWRERLPRRSWFIAVAAQALLVASAFGALQTGEIDEEIVERVVPESAIHEHEEAAETFTYVAAVLLLIFVAAGLVPGRKPALGLATAATLGTLIVFGLGYRVGEAGGELVYVHQAASAHDGAAAGPAQVTTAGRHADDDD